MPIYIDNELVEAFTFNGGERHVKLSNYLYSNFTTDRFLVDVRAILTSSNDIIDLLLVGDTLKRINCEIYELDIPYLPYARQDRVCSDCEPLSLAVIANLINSLGARCVTINDPHSDVAKALINNLNVIDRNSCIDNTVLWYREFEDLLTDNPNLVLLSPDAGAEKETYKIAKELDCPIIFGRKHRDTRTGEITGTTIDYNGVDLDGKDLLVVDDICDGGRTFVEIAKVLQKDLPNMVSLYPKYRYNSLTLYVTHGIFANGKEELLKYYDNVYALNEFWNKD